MERDRQTDGPMDGHQTAIQADGERQTDRQTDGPINGHQTAI